MNLTYDYLKNIQIEKPNAATQTYNANSWYGQITQKQIIKIKVKDKKNFNIANVTGILYSGTDNIIEIAIKNIGEEEAKNVKVIVNPSDPLSTTDNSTFLNTIMPNETAIAKVKIKVDNEAVSKLYGIGTTLKYQTVNSDIKYSDVLEAPVEVKTQGILQRIFGWL